MEEKLEFLREYHKNVRIVDFDEINKIDVSFIPDNWYKTFIEKDTIKRINSILSIWKKYVNDECRNTILYLSENLVDIELIEYNGKYSILYSIKTSEGEVEYFEGGNPKDKFDNSRLDVVWHKIPLSVREFYENVHNGFYLYSSHSMGLVPFEVVTYFDDDEWGIIEELEKPLQINLKTTFGFFKNGAGGYVAIDYNNCNNNNATLWFTDDQPRYNVDFWDVVDEWLVIGFE